MVFEVHGKVAIVTGGASGIGLSCVRALLKNGAKGITLADVNEILSAQAVREIKNEFGQNVILFVQTDVSDLEQFKNTFEKTIEKFGNVDILINNAGLYKDGIWEKEIATNIVGTVNGIILGVNKYLPKYKQGSEAIIVNISSISALEVCSHIPIYGGTKLASLAFTRNWGNSEIYQRTKVKVVAVCPGDTKTDSFIQTASHNSQHTLSEMYDQIRKERSPNTDIVIQESDFVGNETMKVLKHASNGTIWVVENEEPAYQYVFPERHQMKKNKLIEK